MPLVMTADNTFIRDHIALIINTIDTHDAGICDNTYICPCKFQGTQQEWQTHIADLITHKLAEETS
jgi:hypothetical protein